MEANYPIWKGLEAKKPGQFNKSRKFQPPSLFSLPFVQDG